MSYDSWKTRNPDDEPYHRQPYGELHCEQCDSTRDVNENEYGEHICGQCEQNAFERAYERAYERACARFYGGDGVLSLQQQQATAKRLK